MWDVPLSINWRSNVRYNFSGPHCYKTHSHSYHKVEFSDHPCTEFDLQRTKSLRMKQKKTLVFTSHYSLTSSSPCNPPWRHRGEQRYISTLSITSVLDGGINETPRPFYPWEWLVTHRIGGWVGPRAGLDACGKSRSPPSPAGVRSYTTWIFTKMKIACVSNFTESDK